MRERKEQVETRWAKSKVGKREWQPLLLPVKTNQPTNTKSVDSSLEGHPICVMESVTQTAFQM